MSTPKKIETVKSLNQNLREAKSFVLASFVGLKMTQVEDLKRQIEKDQGKLRVAKNSLLKIALKGLKISLPEAIFQGPTLLLTNLAEDFKTLKSLVAYAKNVGAEALKIKIGYFEGRVFNQPETLQLSTLNNRNTLLAQLVSLIKSPLIRLVAALKFDQRKLLVLLSEISIKNQKD